MPLLHFSRRFWFADSILLVSFFLLLLSCHFTMLLLDHLKCAFCMSTASVTIDCQQVPLSFIKSSSNFLTHTNSHTIRPGPFRRHIAQSTQPRPSIFVFRSHAFRPFHFLILLRRPGLQMRLYYGGPDTTMHERLSSNPAQDNSLRFQFSQANDTHMPIRSPVLLRPGTRVNTLLSFT